MDGRNVLLSFSHLVVAAGIAATLSLPVFAQDNNKFAKVDELLKNSGMLANEPQREQTQTTVSPFASSAVGSQLNPEAVLASKTDIQRVNLPEDAVLQERYKNGEPSVNTPDSTLVSSGEQVAVRDASTKTVVMWGSGTGNSTTQSMESGFVSAPGMDVSQRMQRNQSDVLALPFVEIPTGSVVEFAEDISIPASKDGVLFSEGVMTSAVEQKQPNGVLQLMADRAVSSAAPQVQDCALMSDRSNLLMKGSPQHPIKTFLEVERLELIKQLPSERTDIAPVIAKIVFKTKQSKNANDAPVNISLLCTLPKEYWSSPKQYRISDVSKSVGHIFLFKLARVAEI